MGVLDNISGMNGVLWSYLIMASKVAVARTSTDLPVSGEGFNEKL